MVRVKLRETMKYTRDVYTSLLTSQFHLLGVSSVQRDDCVLLQPSNRRQSVLRRSVNCRPYIVAFSALKLSLIHI